MKKKFFIAFFCLLLVLTASVLSAGCADNEENGEQTEQNGTESAETLRVGMLGKDIKTACVILADSLGYFEEEGVNVEFEKINSLPDGLTAVSMDKLDILPFGVIPSCSYISQGTDVVIFGGTISEGSEGVTRDDVKYTELSDFAGKKIGCFRMETGHMVLKGLLREAGVDAEFIYLESSQAIVEAVKKGEVDIGMVNSGYGYVAEQSGAYVAFQVGDFESDFPCCRQTTSRTAVSEKRDALVKFETALLRAYEVYLNDRETTIEALVEYSGQDEAYVEAIMYGTDSYDNAMIVSMDPNKKKVADFYEVMKANGDIDADTEYDINEYIDTTIYEDALKNLIERGENTDLYEELFKEFEENNL